MKVEFVVAALATRLLRWLANHPNCRNIYVTSDVFDTKPYTGRKYER